MVVMVEVGSPVAVAVGVAVAEVAATDPVVEPSVEAVMGWAAEVREKKTVAQVVALRVDAAAAAAKATVAVAG